MSGSCLEGVWRMSSRRLIALGVILNITKGVKMSTDVTQVQFLSCYETTVFFPVPSTLPKIFNSGVSGRCLEGVWVTLDTVWEVLMPNQLIRFQ